MSEETVTLSLRVPRDAYRKLEKIANATAVSISDVATLFLQKKVSATPRKRKAITSK